jgi:stage II sporulation protein AA (anti-sigma F factor antagonist)
VPLYACAHCGFTSAAFQPEAARVHRHENPECDGVMRIIFRSEERLRGEPSMADPPATAASTRAAPAGTGKPDQSFAMREMDDPDQALRLVLLGDLDLSTAPTLSTRLTELKTMGRPTRLDLSEVAFIDSSGIQVLLLALTDARWTGWPLEVARGVSPSVQRAAEIVGIGQVLWPEKPGITGTARATTRPPQ